MNQTNASVPQITGFGELMMRLDAAPGRRLQHTPSFNMYFGGAEANVLVVLAQLGLSTRYVTALPQNDLGVAALHALQQFGVDTSCVLRQGERTGIYFTEHGSGIRAGRVLYDRKGSAFSALKPGEINWDLVLDGSRLFFWSGISASLTQNVADVCLEAVQTAKRKGILIAADMNYRKTLWQYGKLPQEVMPELLSYCDILSGDVDAIETYFGIQTYRDLIKSDQFGHCAVELKKRIPSLKVLSMSFRETNAQQRQLYSGLLMLDEKIYQSPEYALPQVIDRIGSGDAFQGGLMYGLIKELPGDEIVNFATACAVLKHSLEGDFCILSEEEVRQFMKHGPQQRIIR